MRTLQDRLKLAMAGPPKISQAALARACGIRAPSVNDWLSGKTKTIEGQNLLLAAEFLKVSPMWLAAGKGQMRKDAVSSEGPDESAIDALPPQRKTSMSAADMHKDPREVLTALYVIASRAIFGLSEKHAKAIMRIRHEILHGFPEAHSPLPKNLDGVAAAAFLVSEEGGVSDDLFRCLSTA